MASPLVVNYSPGPPGGFFSSHFSNRLRWQFVSADGGRYSSWLQRLTGVNWARIRGGRDAARAAVQEPASLVVSHDPRVTDAAAFFLRRYRFKGPHLAFAFNFPHIPTGLRRRVMRTSFRAVDRFVVYSTMERRLYHEAFDIPLEKIDFIHWGVNPPPVEPVDRPVVTGDYVCAIGGNARDYKTLCAAMSQLPHIRCVAVVRPHNLAGLSVPPNVEIRTDIPFSEAMNVLAFSRFMVLPLAGSEVPCGHVTLVGAMHLGKAFVISNSSGVADYVLPGVNAVVCPPFDPVSLAADISNLWEDRSLCNRLGTQGKAFAAANCSEASTLKWFTGYLQSKGLLRGYPEQKTLDLRGHE